jgi:hypothetical protein
MLSTNDALGGRPQSALEDDRHFLRVEAQAALYRLMKRTQTLPVDDLFFLLLLFINEI